MCPTFLEKGTILDLNQLIDVPIATKFVTNTNDTSSINEENLSPIIFRKEIGQSRRYPDIKIIRNEGDSIIVHTIIMHMQSCSYFVIGNEIQCLQWSHY